MHRARGFEVFEHTADLGIRAWAGTLAELFEEAALALASTIVDNLDQVRPLREKLFTLDGAQLEFLLHDWLTEILCAFELESLLLSEFDVSSDGTGLRALGRGEVVDRGRHRLSHEVKAVTYHGLMVERVETGWLAEVILDI